MVFVGGKTNQGIGTIIGINRHTAQKYLERIYSRLCVENRHAVMAFMMDI
ncbi:MAG: hypothetical protein KF682_09050 [Nitrospira sp.]|nr:hypothetical protein [Nitrospira sp.]